MNNPSPLIVPKGSLVLLSGLPGSGKSVFAEKHFAESEILSSDALRERHFGAATAFSDDGTPYPSFSPNRDISVFRVMEEIASARCIEGLTTVIDAMNLTDDARKGFVALGEWKSVITVTFDPETAVLRNAARSRRLPDSVMDEKARVFEASSSIPGNSVVRAEDVSETIREYPSFRLAKGETAVVFWDIHGSPVFVRAYGRTREEFPDATFFFLGDIVDRGPDSVEILRFLMGEAEAGKKNVFLIGNHEKKLLQSLDAYFANWTVPDTGSLAGYATFRDIVSPWYGKHGVRPELARKNAMGIAAFLRSFLDFAEVRWDGGSDTVLLSHAPFLPSTTEGPYGIHRSDAVYGAYALRGLGSKASPSAFCKALQSVCASNRMKAVFWHADFSEAVAETGSDRIMSIEGGVNSGGDIVSLVLRDGEYVSERRFPSEVGTPGTFFDNSTIETAFKRDFEPLEASKHVSVFHGHAKYGEALGLRKYSKKVFYDRLWGTLSPSENEALGKARGIVLDRLGLPVSYPFDKVFNLGEEVAGSPTSLPDGEYEFVEKKNGFMAVVSPDPFDFANLLVHTQGSLAEGQFKSYVDSLLPGGQRARTVNWFRVNGPHTLVFEALHPEDKHIVEYGQGDFGLCLIGCRDLSPTGEYRLLSETELDKIASELGFPRPSRTVAALSEIMALRKSAKNAEGWMVRDTVTGEHLSKIKTAHYLVTKFLGRMSEGNWKFLISNKKGFVEKNQIDEEFLPLVDYVCENRDRFAAMGKEERTAEVGRFFG